MEDDMERMRNEYTREIDRLNEQRRNDLAQIAERDLGKKAMKREMDKMKTNFDNDLARQKQQLQVWIMFVFSSLPFNVNLLTF